MDGWFHPPPCNASAGGDPSQCATLFAVYPSFDAGMVPQMVTNLGMNVSVVFLGPHFERIVLDRIARGEPTLFYYWRPSGFLLRVGATRISLPAGPIDCFRDGDPATRSNYGPGACDFPTSRLLKVRRVQPSS